MFTNSISKIVVTTLVLAMLFVSASFATHSASASESRVYDHIEGLRISRAFTYVSNAPSYEKIENVRTQRALESSSASYNMIEQLRAARGLSADRSYEPIEIVRLERSAQTLSGKGSNCDRVECSFQLPNGLWIK